MNLVVHLVTTLHLALIVRLAVILTNHVQALVMHHAVTLARHVVSARIALFVQKSAAVLVAKAVHQQSVVLHLVTVQAHHAMTTAATVNHVQHVQKHRINLPCF